MTFPDSLSAQSADCKAFRQAVTYSVRRIPRLTKGLPLPPVWAELAFPESRQFVPFAPALPSRDYRARLRKSQRAAFESLPRHYAWRVSLPSAPPGESCLPFPLPTSLRRTACVTEFVWALPGHPSRDV